MTSDQCGLPISRDRSHLGHRMSSRPSIEWTQMLVGVSPRDKGSYIRSFWKVCFLNPIKMAEGVGFEPTVELPLHLISNQAP